MKIAVVLTVKNEERLLRNNLFYHKTIGADRIFVYFDNTTDNGKESISDLDFVTINDSVSAKKYAHLEYLEKFTSQAEEHHTARQCLNTFDAQQQCEKEGIDWLISLDADELICTDFKESSNLKSFFEGIDENVEVINFKTLEALQQKESYGNVFLEETLFKKNRKQKKGEDFHKNLFNPFTKTSEKFSWWYGQHLGKGAVRIGKGIIPHNVHRFKRIDGSKAETLNAGNVLHYHAYDAADFIKKFTNFSEHPNTFLSGNKVEGIKLLLRDIVNTSGMDSGELKKYFKENLLFTEAEVQDLKKEKTYFLFKKLSSPLNEIISVQRVFKNIIPKK
ncbi:hypothetical protein A7A78_13000 [Aequorivita soesokkakensis]|uniref:Glycosyl transferase family 2 n=1 Tax=Aequorivita soesokkakensis TaxID=1385699 RepID=A0A1A9LEP5_9FLAO|nr:glycosyltransferase family 2 protein [Aequorivita soesokkakensis]OAD91211.1 hypothetical protein A7A78_13000 [Aequorivita soesokkakensis]